MKRSIFSKASIIGAMAASTLMLGGCWADYVGGNYGGMGDDAMAIVGADISGENISKIKLLGSDNLIVKTGATPGISASGDDEVVKLLRYEIDGDTLRIGRTDEESNWSGDDATITVILPNLTDLSVSGSGDANVAEMTGDNAKISIAGNGDVTVKSMTAKSLNGSIAGSGNLQMTGSGETAGFSIAGSGDVDGTNYKSETVSISIAGSGNVDMQSDGKVSAKIAGSGDVNIKGSAKCTSKIAGSGDVNCG